MNGESSKAGLSERKERANYLSLSFALISFSFVALGRKGFFFCMLKPCLGKMKGDTVYVLIFRDKISISANLSSVVSQSLLS